MHSRLNAPCSTSTQTDSTTVFSSGGKSTLMFYLSTNTVEQKYLVTSKSPEFKMYLSKSTKVLASKNT